MGFIICFIILFFGAVIVWIITKKALKDGPMINLVGTKLGNNNTDDIDKATKYLKIVNKD